MADTPELPETLATYLRLRGLEPSKYAKRSKRRKRSSEDDGNQPFMAGRDPKPLGDALDKLTQQSGWSGQLAKEDLVRRWEDVAGTETAQHSEPTSLMNGTLTIQCDSTAWAKNLQFMRAHILHPDHHAVPGGGVDAVRFVGPDAPSGSGARARFPAVGRGTRTGEEPHRNRRWRSELLYGPVAAIRGR